MNCTYCYLQSFLNQPFLQIYSNIAKALSELKEMKKELADSPLRIGTGEVIDSLSLDEITLYSRKLIEFFRDAPRWQLELKTKSNKVDHFIDLGPAQNIVVSWSISPKFIVDNEEKGTASLNERLIAAQRCLDNGFKIAFHIDPLVWHPQWKDSYSDLARQICAQFKHDEIPYISLGTLRYQPEQRHIMRERHGMKSWAVRAEMFKSNDGKLRYDKSLRKEMYDFVLSEFKSNSQGWKVFMCMETPEIWLKTQSQLPKTIPGLKDLFDHKVIKSHKQFKSKSEAPVHLK